ncbi:MAG: hypothetical protein ACRDRV_01495, partial [Pseudonocardiaceae bacterium]
MTLTTAVSDGETTLRTLSGRRLRELVLDRTQDLELAHEVDVVSQVLPFKVSSYVVDELIDWDRAPDDAIYRLVFPHRDMLDPADFADVERALRSDERSVLRTVVDRVRD